MIRFSPIPTETLRRYQSGGADANGQTSERQISTGSGNPCRHCLANIPEGAGMLVLAHRPFPSVQPYAEIGPIFLCADPCEAGGGANLPEILTAPDYIVRGYGPDDRIVYGTGAVVATASIPAEAEARLADPVWPMSTSARPATIASNAAWTSPEPPQFRSRLILSP